MISRVILISVLHLFVININVYAQPDSLIYDNLSRTYLLHIPPGYTGNDPTPLVVAMHGGFGSAGNLESQSQLSVKSDAAGFIVVYPEGYPSSLNIRTWNAGWCCGASSTNNVDDVGFISTLLDTLISQYNIDTTRIYATGMSNGGFMSYRLGCELSDRIAAIAPVAASMSMTSCNPSRPVPIIQFHSYLDNNVPYQGGVGGGVSNHWNSPHDSVLNVWSANNGCTVADTTIMTGVYNSYKFLQCSCNSEIHYYITYDGGHSWPGGVATIVGDPPSTALSANDFMWDFFQMHSLNCDSSLTVNELLLTGISISPNPSQGIFYFSGITPEGVEVFNTSGMILISQTINNSTDIKLDLTAFADGVYTCRVTAQNGKTFFLKLIKNSGTK